MMAAEKRRLVIGMGASGYSLANFWYGDYALTAVDDRRQPPRGDFFQQQLPAVTTRVGDDFRCWRPDDYAAYDKVALSPGVAPECVRAPADKLTNDAACFSEAWQVEAPAASRLLAVTGTNGKSTVTMLAAHLVSSSGLAAAAVGNIGEPMLTALLDWRYNGFPAVAVVELSSFQLELAAQFYSDAAVVLNIGEDHLDRHGSFQHYADIKRSIYRNTRCVVVNDALAAMPAAAVSYGSEAADWYIKDGVIWRRDEPRYRLSSLSEVCRHYPELVLAALALTDSLDLPTAAVQAGLASFSGLPHRRQFVANQNGVIYVNDSKATNVEAALFALRHAGAPVVWIGGGDGKGQDFAALAAAGARFMRAAVLFGKDAVPIEKALTAAGVVCARAADLADAVAKARTAARPHDVVLLSPACSSLDMFANYQTRGMEFMRMVTAEDASASPAGKEQGQ